MTVAELQVELGKFDAGYDVLVAVNGTIAPAIGVAGAANASFVVVRAKGKTTRSKTFSIAEVGVLGHLANLGVPDSEIADVLGRQVKEVSRKRAALGYSDS
jgi:hypothetical protein